MKVKTRSYLLFASELYALDGGVDFEEAELSLQPPFPPIFTSFEAVETTFLTKLSKIRALIWPLFGGSFEFSFWGVEEEVVSIGVKKAEIRQST